MILSKISVIILIVLLLDSGSRSSFSPCIVFPERHVWLWYTLVLATIIRLLLAGAHLDVVICSIVAAKSFSLEASNYRRFAYLRARV